MVKKRKKSQSHEKVNEKSTQLVTPVTSGDNLHVTMCDDLPVTMGDARHGDWLKRSPHVSEAVQLDSSIFSTT